MILYENAAGPLARAGEIEVGGRRIAGRLLPYGSESSLFARCFDPVARRFGIPRAESSVSVGPARSEDWREAAARLPSGPVLVGPGNPAEEIRGAYRAAAQGALAAGRGVYLLDPEPEGLPDADGGVVALCAFAPGGGPAFPVLEAARARGAVSGVVFPLIPGWTAEPDAVEKLLVEAARGGARSATPIVPESDGESRRAIVEAFASHAPVDFFDRIHHRDWTARMTGRLPEVRALCAAHGLAAQPPRARGRGEPSGNAAAAARLEELAELETLPEHRAADLRAAVRWIDECGRDLVAIAREGNFRKVFPFGSEIAEAAERAWRADE